MMTISPRDRRHDPDNDEMRFPYPLTGAANSEVRVCRSAVVQGEPWVRARIEGYFKYCDKPRLGTSVKIPDYQFDANLFQPEEWS
jgi:hypothetical protein